MSEREPHPIAGGGAGQDRVDGGWPWPKRTPPPRSQAAVLATWLAAGLVLVACGLGWAARNPDLERERLRHTLCRSEASHYDALANAARFRGEYAVAARYRREIPECIEPTAWRAPYLWGAGAAALLAAILLIWARHMRETTAHLHR